MPRAYGRLFILQDGNSDGFFTASELNSGLFFQSSRKNLNLTIGRFDTILGIFATLVW
jgi:hypothetical protein